MVAHIKERFCEIVLTEIFGGFRVVNDFEAYYSHADLTLVIDYFPGDFIVVYLR